MDEIRLISVFAPEKVGPPKVPWHSRVSASFMGACESKEDFHEICACALDTMQRSFVDAGYPRLDEERKAEYSDRARTDCEERLFVAEFGADGAAALEKKLSTIERLLEDASTTRYACGRLPAILAKLYPESEELEKMLAQPSRKRWAMRRYKHRIRAMYRRLHRAFGACSEDERVQEFIKSRTEKRSGSGPGSGSGPR
jgi:hypothetical protein